MAKDFTISSNFTEPWNSVQADSSLSKDAFFSALDIKRNRWDKLYGYRLLVVEIPKNGTNWRIVGSSRFSTSVDKPKLLESGIEYRITHQAQSNTWEAVLPITPEQLSITDQFAINTTATMRGIVEEHNGVRFKNINIAGTTGIWPSRPTKAGSIESTSIAGTIAGGTIAAFESFGSSLSKIAKAATGEHINQPTEVETPDNYPNQSTGYYEALYLGQFLERYAQAKKNPKNKGWRLVIDMPKRNESYIVTPVSFTSRQNNARPNEYLFNIQLKAWKRINLEQSIKPAAAKAFNLQTNGLAKIVNTISATRKALSNATNLVKAVRSDASNVFNILRQTSLAAKDLGGLAFTVADLPDQILNDFKSTIKTSLNDFRTAFDRPVSRGGSGAGGSTGTSSNTAVSIKSASSSIRAGAAVNAIVNQQEANEGLSEEAVLSGALGSEAAEATKANSLNNIFENPSENFELFNDLSLNALTLTPQQQQAIDDELERVRLITIEDLRTFRKELVSLSLQLTNNFGAGNDTYSNIYGLQTPKERDIPMTIEENEIVASIWESIQQYDILISTKQYDDLNVESPLEYVGGLANEAGIDFEQFPSKILVPVPFGLTIEEIAARYMGDADKWIEIATLNNMRSPYIDEDGFTMSFLSNSEGRRFNVDNSSDQLYLGQTIILKSDTVLPFSRKIIEIEKLSDNNYLITVNGEDNLDNLTTLDNASMQGYLPGTVNSQNQIYIPISEPSEEDDRIFEIPFLEEENLTKLSKIDFLLTDDNDIAINSVGDFRLANGLTNLVQALKLKVITKKGTLLRHLDYGIGLEVGVSLADIENGSIVDSLNSLVEQDERFSGIERLDIELKGPALKIDMAVNVANNSGIVPISFNVGI